MLKQTLTLSSLLSKKLHFFKFTNKIAKFDEHVKIGWMEEGTVSTLPDGKGSNIIGHR